MAAPPLLAGAAKVTVAAVSPAVAVPMVGAPGTMALTGNVCDTVAAAFHAPLPAWSALMLQEPAVTKVRRPPDVMVHTPVVVDVNETGNPDVALAPSVGEVPKFCAPGLANVMLWVPLGTTALDAAEGALVPTALVAVTVKV